jgi:Zn-dependent protease/CBS domain-containing protein
MRPSIRLGRIFGIDIGLHYSWLIIAVLIVFSLSAHFRFTNPQWGPAVVWSLAAVTALLFFASILAHELAHAAVARRRGLPVKSITLFALGGVANMGKEPDDAKSEFWIAAAGPITSILLGLMFLGLAAAAGSSPWTGTPRSPLWAGFVWLGYINIVLAVFNMIPGFPLDGGRVLRAIVWKITGDGVKATQVAGRIGQGIAVLFIVFGFFRFFAAADFGGLWLAFIGWFLAEAAASSQIGVQTSNALAGARVGDVMSHDCPAVDAELNLRTFAEDYLLRTGRRCFVVVQDNRQIGLVTTGELKRIPRERWPFMAVAEAARTLSNGSVVSPETPVTDALDLMVREDLDQLPVVSNRQLVGMIGRSDILQILKTRKELKAAA